MVKCKWGNPALFKILNDEHQTLVTLNVWHQVGGSFSCPHLPEYQANFAVKRSIFFILITVTIMKGCIYNGIHYNRHNTYLTAYVCHLLIIWWANLNFSIKFFMTMKCKHDLPSFNKKRILNFSKSGKFERAWFRHFQKPYNHESYF